MKKILISILTILSIFLFSSSVNAAKIEYYESVNFSVVFDQDVDVNKVGDVQINLNDQFYGEQHSGTLNKKNNYKSVITSIPKKDVSANIIYEYIYEYSDISGDNTGELFSDNCTLTKNGNELNVVLRISNKKPGTTVANVNVPDEVMERINNTTKESNTTSTTVSTSETTTKSVKYDEDGNIILDDEDEDETSTTTSTKETTTNADGLNEEQLKEKQEKIAKKNSLIAKIMFGTIGVIALFAIIKTGVKIAKANK